MRDLFFRNVTREQFREAVRIHLKNSFGYVIVATVLIFFSTSQYTQYVMVIEPTKAVGIAAVTSLIVFVLINWYALLSYIPEKTE
jgi:hypothetical protein